VKFIRRKIWDYCRRRECFIVITAVASKVADRQ